MIQGQIQFKGGSLTGPTFHVNSSAVIFDDPRADGKAQPQTSSLLCAEEGLKDFGQIILINPKSRVREAEHDP